MSPLDLGTRAREWFLPLDRLQSSDESRVGGKAAGLGQLLAFGFDVPKGLVLSRPPESEDEWHELLAWWTSAGQPKLAVRSSAVGEDSKEFSFAGQQTTVLNVSSESALRHAVHTCFQSIHKEASRAYRAQFGVNSAPRMNVVLQEMIDALYAGVFFSCDPRGAAGDSWLLEVVAGLGERLVSGSVTPQRFKKDQPLTWTGRVEEGKSWTAEDGEKIVSAGLRVKKYLGYDVDMEWAIGQDHRLWILQARPVTAAQSRARLEHEIEKELSRLKKRYSDDVIWDGQTFAEWTGMPSYLTFSIWKHAFTPQAAFGQALRKLGYEGSATRVISPKESLLERVFGRAYVNLSLLEPLFFGPTPYVIVPKPRPHLEFRWSRVTLKKILRAPKGIVRMGRVGWKLQTERRLYLKESRKALAAFRDECVRPLDPKLYTNWDDATLRRQLRSEFDIFTEKSLLWPFALVVLAESTMQTLQTALARVVGKQEAEKQLRRWLGWGLDTITREMTVQYHRAAREAELRPFFLARFGHRGPGELDLSHPRWVELGDAAFQNMGHASEVQDDSKELEAEFARLPRLRGQVIRQEWEFLKEILELREQWKMEILRPYAHIRWMALELGRRNGLSDSIFWLRLSEILSNGDLATYKHRIDDRKTRFHAFRHLSFPVVTTLGELEGVLNGGPESESTAMEGEGLSSGVAFGEVRVVSDPAAADVANWPAQTILVAEATDPGWTPLFQRAKGVIVEKGGVLSHCAIVAREMALPAVSNIRRIHLRLRDGDRVWVDGSHGRVTRVL